MIATENESKQLVSIHKVWKNNDIYWIKTYKTLLKYVSNDYKDIFQPIIKGKRSGKRYFLSSDKIKEFVNKFENNELAE